MCGFHQVIGVELTFHRRAKLERQVLQKIVVPGDGDHIHGPRCRVLLDLTTDIKTIQSGHQQVEQHHMGLKIPHLAPGGKSIVGNLGEHRIGKTLDNLLQVRRGETIKIRTGDYNPTTNVLGFGYKFQVLERTPPFSPEDFGVPPEEFRGFRGELTGKVVEALG